MFHLYFHFRSRGHDYHVIDFAVVDYVQLVFSGILSLEMDSSTSIYVAIASSATFLDIRGAIFYFKNIQNT